MFKNILVPTDFAPRDVKALEIAFKLCTEENGRVSLIHVVETIDDTDGEEFQPFYDKLTQMASRKMDKIIGRMEPVKRHLHTHILYGRRVTEIVRFAKETEVDLIALSSHRIEKARAAEGWATISYRVAILAPCPVLMVK